MLEQFLARVKSLPEDLEDRKKLREAERKQVKKPKLKSFSLTGIKIKDRALAVILAECEDRLFKNPYDVPTLLTLGKAIASQDLMPKSLQETAIYIFYDVVALVNEHIKEYKEAKTWMCGAHKGLGDVYVQKEEYTTALKAYRAAEKFADNEEKRTELNKLISDTEALETTQRYEEGGQEESKERRTAQGMQIKEERKQERRESAEKPKEKTPLDAAVEFYNSKDYVPALEKLQQSVKVAASEINAKSHLYIGLCYEALSENAVDFELVMEFAETHYTAALEAASKTNDEKLRLEILYTRGILYAEAGDQAKARRDFMEIFDTDVNYRDVREKIFKKL